MSVVPAIYVGTVTHRLRPVAHALHYDVASLLVDVDDLAAGRTPLLLSHNGFNPLSIHDKDHGEQDGAASIRDYAWREVRKAGLEGEVSRILMFAYPRILGYAFNPLTTYYALDAGSNTPDDLQVQLAGGRHTYVVGPDGDAGASFGTVDKVFRVSPFNGVEGTYEVACLAARRDEVAVSVSLTTAEGPLLKAWFHGQRRPLTSPGPARRLRPPAVPVPQGHRGHPLEALKLWLKGASILQSPS